MTPIALDRALVERILKDLRTGSGEADPRRSERRALINELEAALANAKSAALVHP